MRLALLVVLLLYNVMIMSGFAMRGRRAAWTTGGGLAKHLTRGVLAMTDQPALNFSTGAVDRDAWLSRKGVWDDKDLGTLMNANNVWRERMKTANPNFFEYNKMGHDPKILWIGCSDARVPANEIIGEPAGSVFVHRNIANQVVSTDFNAMSVIQYAVQYLKVKHVIVCGHYDCGGVKAALTNLDHGAPLENWVRHIRDTCRLHQKELGAIEVLFLLLCLRAVYPVAQYSL